MKTKQEIIDELMLNQDVIDVMRKIEDKSELFHLHHTVGQYIRNTYNLWNSENIPNNMNPDDYSYAILQDFYDQLKAN